MTGPVHKPGHLRHSWPSTPSRCDICGRSRNSGGHDQCSKARQAANARPITVTEGDHMQLPHALIEHFANLGAPLATLDSTSAVRPDGAVVLACWADRKRSLGGPYPYRLLIGAGVTGERRDHVDALLGDTPARGFLVIATANDLEARPRTMRTFNAGTVVPVGRVVVIDGAVWAECLPPIPTRDA